MKRLYVRGTAVNGVRSVHRRRSRAFRIPLFFLVASVLLLPVLPPVLASSLSRLSKAAAALGSLLHPAAANPAAAQLPQEQHFLHIPFFMEGGGFTSVLTLNNNMAEPMNVEVTLYNLSGDALPLPAITLPPQMPMRFDIGALTKGSKAGLFSTGNVLVTFEGVSMGVTSQVTVISPSRRMAFESSEDETMAFITSRLDGIVWLPDPRARASIVLTNTSTRPLVVTGTATGDAGVNTLKAELGPHATEVVDATRFAVVGPGAGEPASVAPALLTLQQNGNPGDLMVTSFVTDDKTAFSCNLPFTDSATTVSNQLAGAHIRMGLAAASEGFPKGTTFSAPLVLANVGGQPSQAAVSVDYTINSVPHRIQLGVVTLSQRDTRTIDLAAALSARGITGPLDDAGLDVLYSGPPGTVIGRLASFDQSGDYSFDVPVKDPLAGMARAGGDYPWRLDNGYSSIVHLKNVLDKPVQAIVQIRYDGGTYNPERIPLQPYQTIALDIGGIRDAQKPDIRKSVMPKDVTTGQVIWWELTPGSLIGRAEISSVNQGVASSFSCGSGPCPPSFDGASLDPNSLSALVGDFGSFRAEETNMDCLGTLYGPFTVNATWSSSNTSVVTVDSSGNMSCPGVGTATVTATFIGTIYECGNGCVSFSTTATPTGGVTVNPRISGANSIWWFGGLSPTGYITATMLTASTTNASSYQWAITAGNVVFSNGSKSMTTSTNQVLVRSSGYSPVNQPNDVAIQVTIQLGTKSYQSAPFNMTVLAPHSLLLTQPPDDEPDSLRTYVTHIHYEIRDQYDHPLPTSVAASEFFTTPDVADFPGEDWPAASPNGGTVMDPTDFVDSIAPPAALGLTPDPTPPQAPLSTEKVVHGSGQFQIGSATPGQGLVVQTQTWQHYIDHGRHLNVVSPVPGQ